MTAYIEWVISFFDTNNLPGDKGTATFLNGLGKNTFQVLRNLILPRKVYGKSQDQVTKVLLNHYDPKPLVISERFNFNLRNQEPYVNTYVLLHDWEGNMGEYSIQDRPYWPRPKGGMIPRSRTEYFPILPDPRNCLWSKAMRKKFLVEEGLNFACAVKIAQSMESATQKTKLLQSTATTVSPTPEVNMLTFRGKADSCYRCGRTDHPPTHCPFKNAQFPNCGRIGYIQQACRSKLRGSPLSHSRRGRGGGTRSRKHYAGGRGYNLSV